MTSFTLHNQIISKTLNSSNLYLLIIEYICPVYVITFHQTYVELSNGMTPFKPTCSLTI